MVCPTITLLKSQKKNTGCEIINGSSPLSPIFRNNNELMQPNPKKVLLLYTDKYYLVKQIYPFGLDIIADYLRRHSYDVTIDFPFLPEIDPETNLTGILERETPT